MYTCESLIILIYWAFKLLDFYLFIFLPHCSCPGIITALRLGNSLPVFHHGQLYYLFRSPISGITEAFICVSDFFQPASCYWEFSCLKNQHLINLYCLSVIQMADMIFFIHLLTERHLNYFQNMTIINKVSINICIQM